MVKRVLILIGVALVVGLVIGNVSGYALKTHITAKDKQKTEEQTLERSSTKTLVYGAYDDRTFTQEISLDWGAGDLDFTPLDCKMPEEQQEFTYYLCTGYNIDFTLVMALIQNESSFDPSVVSATHDYGYMQINEMNHQWLTDTLGVTDFTDPYQNIRVLSMIKSMQKLTVLQMLKNRSSKKSEVCVIKIMFRCCIKCMFSTRQ